MAMPRREESKEKISVTVDRDVWEQARALPWASSGSEVVNEALRRLVASERLRSVLEELDEIHGPVPEELVEEARKKWHRR